jgi:GDP-D-mannose dehydratase
VQVLITGITWSVGRHVAEDVLRQGAQAFGPGATSWTTRQ